MRGILQKYCQNLYLINIPILNPEYPEISEKGKYDQGEGAGFARNPKYIDFIALNFGLHFM